MAFTPAKFDGKELEHMGLLTRTQIKEALQTQKNTKERIGDILVKSGFISAEMLPRILSMPFGIVPTPIADLNIPKEVIETISPTIARLQRMIPLALEKGTLTIAVASALDLLSVDNISGYLGRKIEAVVVGEEAVEQLLQKHYGGKKPDEPAAAGEGGEIAELVAEEEAKKGASLSEDDAPIVKLAVQIIADAYRIRSSDIHLEPLADRFRIRYRVDGVLHEIASPPRRLQPAVISRVKLLAGMNIAEKRLPQDGKIAITVHDRALDLRVSSLPGIYGESVVMRILDKSSLLLGLNELGFMPDDEEIWRKLLNRPHGIILLTGPTGSGKTTTLYGSLMFLNKPDRKLVTIEDPVEYQIDGINQVEVRPHIGLTFAAGLRSILRQAPNIILVGEIRDLETATIAIQAALTGHLVFSTLHTNDAPGAATRLIDMGVKPYLVASSIQAVMGQRLVRTICSKCREPYQPTDLELKSMDLTEKDLVGANVSKGRGCSACHNTGFKGRKGLFELMQLSNELRKLIVEKKSANIIRKQARKEGMRTLREDGIRKILSGMTTFSEVVQITQTYEEG